MSIADLTRGDTEFDFEHIFPCGDDQFEATSNHSEDCFLHVIEGVDSWGVSEWRAAASWTVTKMVDHIMLNYQKDKDDINYCDSISIDPEKSQQKIRQLNRYKYKFGYPVNC